MPRLAYVRALVALSAATVAVLVPPPAQAAPPWIYRDSGLAPGKRRTGRGRRHRPRADRTQFVDHRNRPQSRSRGRCHPRLRARLPDGIPARRCRSDHGRRRLRPPFRYRDLRNQRRPRGQSGAALPLGGRSGGWGGARSRASRLPSHRAQFQLRHDVRRSGSAAIGRDRGDRHRRLRARDFFRLDADRRQHSSAPVVPGVESCLAGTAVRAARRQPGRHARRIPAGVRPGSMLNRSIDLRTWFLFPDMARSEAARSWASASPSHSGSRA